MDAVERRLRQRAGWISLVAGTVIFAGKLSAWRLTGSTAVFSDALESVVNVAAASLLVWSLRVAARPADRDHPYGHGKIEFFSAGIEGALVLMAAGLIAFEAIRELIAGPSLQRLDLGASLLALFAVANAALGMYLARTAKATRSAALAADARHVLTDVWTTLGVLVGLGMVAITGWSWLDPVIALGVAGHILREGWRVTRDAVAGLMDATDEPTLDRIAARLEAARAPEWIDLHRLRTWRAGTSLHVDLHLQVPRYLDVDTLHEIHDSIEGALAETVGDDGDVVVHFDPCRPNACPRCNVADCPVREQPFARRHPIDVNSATRADPEFDHGPGLRPPA